MTDLLIAQITDLHLGFAPGENEPNRQRLDAVIDTLLAMERAPDLMLATGDLTEHGTPDAYAALRDALGRCPWPVWLIPGNHDQRIPLRAAFPNIPVQDGFMDYALDAGALRILMLDTLEEGRHGGSFCERRAEWLAAELALHPDRPTLIALHHPPIETGIGWMSADPAEPWVERLAAVIAQHPQIVRVITGHVHRPIMAQWSGTSVWISPSTAPQVALDLRAVTGTPDDRAMIIAEPPGFSLHLWNGRSLVSHAGLATTGAVLARYTEAMQPLVQGMLDERAGTQSSIDPLSGTL